MFNLYLFESGHPSLMSKWITLSDFNDKTVLFSNLEYDFVEKSLNMYWISQKKYCYVGRPSVGFDTWKYFLICIVYAT